MLAFQITWNSHTWRFSKILKADWWVSNCMMLQNHLSMKCHYTLSWINKSQFKFIRFLEEQKISERSFKVTESDFILLKSEVRGLNHKIYQMDQNISGMRGDINRLRNEMSDKL